MKRIRFGILFSVALLVAVALVAEAHHASVMFDSTKEITLEGTVKEFQYTNPHSWLLVDVTRRYTQVDNPDKSVRMNYWHCSENPNNQVYKTPEGSTQYRDFTFTNKENR